MHHYHRAKNLVPVSDVLFSGDHKQRLKELRSTSWRISNQPTSGDHTCDSKPWLTRNVSLPIKVLRETRFSKNESLIYAGDKFAAALITLTTLCGQLKSVTITLNLCGQLKSVTFTLNLCGHLQSVTITLNLCGQLQSVTR